LRNVACRADGNVDVVESRSVGRREVRVSTPTLLYHVTLVTGLFTCLENHRRKKQFVTAENHCCMLIRISIDSEWTSTH